MNATTDTTELIDREPNITADTTQSIDCAPNTTDGEHQ